MSAAMSYLDANGPAIVFNVALVAVFYLIARVLSVRQGIALAFAFLPLIVGFAYRNLLQLGLMQAVF